MKDAMNEDAALGVLLATQVLFIALILADYFGVPDSSLQCFFPFLAIGFAFSLFIIIFYIIGLLFD